jgi:hypothetical protein
LPQHFLFNFCQLFCCLDICQYTAVLAEISCSGSSHSSTTFVILVQ